MVDEKKVSVRMYVQKFTLTPDESLLTSLLSDKFTLDTMDLDLSPFIMHKTFGLKKFEQLLRDDVYCTVPEALAQTYAVLVKPTISIGEDGQPIVGAPIKVN